MLEEETTPQCLFGPSLFCLSFIVSCVGVGRILKKASAASSSIYWKKKEESLWNFYTGLPAGCLDFYSYGQSLKSRSGVAKEE